MTRYLVAAALLVSTGCLDPLVGAECAPELDWCAGQCRDLSSDPDNCGACGVVCPGSCDNGFCIDDGAPTPDPGEDVGGEALICDTDELACGGGCVDPLSNPYHCGGCGRICASGLCDQGLCLDLLPGHLMLIGHDLRTINPAIQRIVGNAVFTSPRQEVRVAIYDGSASAAAVANADRAIAREAVRRGRSWRRVAVTPGAMEGVDVLLVHAQPGGQDAALRELGAAWAPDLERFIAAGGIVVQLDGPAAHQGSHQILEGAGLIELGGRSPVSAPSVAVVAPADGLAAGVPLQYATADSTVWFSLDGPGAVIADDARPVVIHRSPP